VKRAWSESCGSPRSSSSRPDKILYMGKSKGRVPGRTRKVFVTQHGQGPWSCCVCSEEIMKFGRSTYDGNIHHLDDDATNDIPDNLVIAHTICHQRHFHPITLDMRDRISSKLKNRPSPTKGMKFSAETNRKKSHPGENNPFFGKQHTGDSLSKMRQPRERKACSDCNRVFAVNWINRHKVEGMCVPSTA
jgi:5-methylcytosine-specific restriction endonuclease McrA